MRESGKPWIGGALAATAVGVLLVAFGTPAGGSHAALPGLAARLGAPFGAGLALAVGVAGLWLRDPGTLAWAGAAALAAGLGVAAGSAFRHPHIALDGWDRQVTGAACAAALVAGVRWWRGR